MFRSRVSPLATFLGILVSALASFSISVFAQSHEQVLYAFTYPPSCSSPSAPLIADEAGNLYGTTPVGGTSAGCVFELSRSGSGGWPETVLYNFSGGLDADDPLAGLVLGKAGQPYGATRRGGLDRPRV